MLLEHHPFLPTAEGDIQTSSSRKLYTTGRMDLAIFEPEVHELALDLEVLLELQAELPEGPRRMRILQAMDNALDVLDLQRITDTAPAARAELAEVLAKRADESAHRISAVGHSHIDSAWLWPVRETIRKVARTASSMVEMLGDDEDFLYGMSSAQQYAWIKEHRPEVYGRVKEAVASGRFLPLGGMWVEIRHRDALGRIDGPPVLITARSSSARNSGSPAPGSGCRIPSATPPHCRS